MYLSMKKAFLTPEYLQNHPNEVGLVEELKRLIVGQTPIIEECLRVSNCSRTFTLCYKDEIDIFFVF